MFVLKVRFYVIEMHFQKIVIEMKGVNESH